MGEVGGRRGGGGGEGGHNSVWTSPESLFKVIDAQALGLAH